MFRPSLPHSTYPSFSPHSITNENSRRSPTSPVPPTPEDFPIRTIPNSATGISTSDTQKSIYKPHIEPKQQKTQNCKKQRCPTSTNLLFSEEDHITTDGPWAYPESSHPQNKPRTTERKRRNNHLAINTTLAQAYKPYQALPILTTHRENNAQSEESAGSSPVDGSEESETSSPDTSLLVGNYRDEDGLDEDKKSALEEEEKEGKHCLSGSTEGSPQYSLRLGTLSPEPIAAPKRFIDGEVDVVVDVGADRGHGPGESAFVVMDAESDTADMEDEDEEESVADAGEECESDDELIKIDIDIEVEGMLNERVNGWGSRRGSRGGRHSESTSVSSPVRDSGDGLFCQSASERDSEDDDESSIPSPPSSPPMAREGVNLDLDSEVEVEMGFVVVDSDADVDEDDLEDRYGGLRGVGEKKGLTGCMGRKKAGIDDGALRLDGMVWQSVCSKGGEGTGGVWCVRRC